MLGIQFFVAFLLAISAIQTAQAEDGGIEYRLEVKDGVPFHTHEGKEFLLAPLPFMTGADVVRVDVLKSKSPDLAAEGIHDVELVHSPVGKAKFRAVADADRTREFCILFHEEIVQCYAFPPVGRDIYDRATSIYGKFSKADAEKFAADIRRTLR